MSRTRWFLLVAAALLAGVFFYFDLSRHLTLESLKLHREALLRLYAGHRVEFISGFIAVYILQTALSLPGATIFTLAGGAIFGVILGTICDVFAATIGATLAFLATRHLFGDLVREKFGRRLEKIDSELTTQGLNYLLFVRLVPIFPFFIINLASGLTGMRLRTFTLGTFFGIIPGGFVYCNAGASLASINRVEDIASTRVVISLVLLGLLSLLPVWYRKRRGKRP